MFARVPQRNSKIQHRLADAVMIGPQRGSPNFQRLAKHGDCRFDIAVVLLQQAEVGQRLREVRVIVSQQPSTQFQRFDQRRARPVGEPAEVVHQAKVVQQGRIIEMGTHEALMALEGQYATLFELQAAAYR